MFFRVFSIELQESYSTQACLLCCTNRFARDRGRNFLFEERHGHIFGHGKIVGFHRLCGLKWVKIFPQNTKLLNTFGSYKLREEWLVL